MDPTCHVCNKTAAFEQIIVTIKQLDTSFINNVKANQCKSTCPAKTLTLKSVCRIHRRRKDKDKKKLRKLL